jgi:phosphoribosylamine--glycine ligase
VNVLILGNGGREHALAWGLSKSRHLGRLACAPGNAGTASLADNVALDPSNGAEILSFCRREEIDLVIVGPEAPLVAGVADVLRAESVLVFGPSKQAARLEGSKAFAKEIMQAEGVPTARSATVRTVSEATKALEWLGDRVAVKADGLAAGKGVAMAESRDDALEAVRACVEARRFGEAGARVVLEEWLEGEEVSIIALVDGEEVRPFAASQDHKRAYEGDHGPNTGGMGAYAPYPGLDREQLEEVVERCLRNALRGLARRDIPYRGVLYAGLMLTDSGPKVLEYNVRFGDPEAEAILPLVEGDLLELFAATARGELFRAPPLGLRAGSALTVVAASAGYPVSSEAGHPVEGLEELEGRREVLVFHAGTARDAAGRVVTTGGRVLAVTGIGRDLSTARDAAYRALGSIRFQGMFARRDIGSRGLALEAAISKGGAG